MSERLDVALVARGLATSRTQAQTLVRSGLVRVAGAPVTRPAAQVGDELLEVTASGDAGEAEWIRRGWVGRGALKLHRALEVFDVRVSGRRCLDVGASTGGFTQVLLEHGAAHVVALDVGHGQLEAWLAGDPRVQERSGVSIRDVGPEDLDGPVDVLVADLSFISLRLVLPVLPRLVREGGDLVLLVKPQFEVGREALGKGGVVRSARQRERVLRDLDQVARRVGLVPVDLEHSPVTGSSGNVEYLWWLRAAHPEPRLSGAEGMMGRGPETPPPGPDEMARRVHDLTQEEDG